MAPVWRSTVLDIGAWCRTEGNFDKTIHRPEILTDYAK
jgi:hypothetical protein